MSSILLNYKIKFEGKDADRHLLEAYPTAHTLEGLTWALALTLHFGITGQVRGRGDLSKSAKIFISPPKRGSVINDLNILVQQNPFLVATVGAYTVNAVSPYINGLLKYAFNHALGIGGGFSHGVKKKLSSLNQNDLEKLVERIEPPLTRAHTVIGKTADTVSFKSKRTEIAKLDLSTKAYLEAKRTDAFETIDTNVTSFNVLTGNGRMYDPESGETAAFSLSSSIQDGTKNTLILSMDQFASSRQGNVRIVVQRVETIERRLKKFIVSSAQEIPRADWIDGTDPLRALR